MARAKATPTVTQSGKTITIDAPGYEFLAEDIGWLNLHFGVLKRLKGRIRLTFPTVRAAQAAFEEMANMGAANVDSVPGMAFVDDTITGLVARLIGEKGKAPRKGG